ncbi:MAG: hypothetical protein IT306_14695 [Chloroflexi bacterium]|nr:hypothetical protein [Chloroflexota bacterium]
MSNRKPVLKVTAVDLETGDVQEVLVPSGEYVILTTEPCHVDCLQQWSGGKTVQLTIKGRLL